jgi:hypothetical protein
MLTERSKVPSEPKKRDFFPPKIPQMRAAPSPGEHLGLFRWEKKHQVFSPAAANET